MLINLKELSTAQVYFTMTQTIMPRPVAWVLSENEDQSLNLAPFSYFNAVASDPPLIMFSVGTQDDGTLKDTLVNVKARPELVVHIASCNQLTDLNLSSATLPAGESEVSAGNLQTSSVEGYRLPRLSDSKIAFMCHVHKIDKIGNNNQHLIFAEINDIYVADDCTETNEKGRLQIKADAVEPLARLGASQYASFGEVLSAKRPG
jgi:flavin reductase (DIM6/NTAB) family NADH-FMN oxidoreductase RutF